MNSIQQRPIPSKKFDPSALPGYGAFIILMYKLQKATLNIHGRVDLSMNSLMQAFEIVRKSESAYYG